ncbi:MAG: DUF123 domain-containing protein [Gammaproteobacteria bacterium]
MNDARPGTYVLALVAPAAQTCMVGRLGTVTLVPGYYLYVGSAFGPGGVRARVRRHLRRDRRRHWHLDYLGEALTAIEAWYTHDVTRREHEFAAMLAGRRELRGVAGFGCSDCACATHLFVSHTRPRPGSVLRRYGGTVSVCTLAVGDAVTGTVMPARTC